VDALDRSWRLLLILLAGCPHGSKLGPVGVSGGGSDHEHEVDATTLAPVLEGLPLDFRTRWNKIGSRVASEHERFTADVYEEGQRRYIEDLSVGDAAAGFYLLERGDAVAGSAEGGTAQTPQRVRFAVADERGRFVADVTIDGGPSLEACVRCHANARDSVYPIVQ
jgi:hypothetical protein